jgi:hypothetical protein
LPEGHSIRWPTHIDDPVMHEPIYENIDQKFGDLLALLDEREVQPEDRAMLWLTGLIAAAVVIMTGGYLFAKLLV